MNTKNKTGFTLIEMVVVFAIIGILITVALSGVNYANKVAKDNKYKQYAVAIVQALNEYYSAENKYPYGDCPSTGIESMTTLTSTLLPLASQGLDQQAYVDYQNAYNAMQKDGSLNSFGYCAAPVSSSGNSATAFVVAFKANTTQSCQDSNNNDVYAVGAGNYTLSNSLKTYVNIPTDYNTTLINSTISSVSSIPCFKK